jgi:hypothetical protein
MKFTSKDRLHMPKKVTTVIDPHEPNEIVALGASLRPIDPNILKPGYASGIKRIWFQGEEPYFDVFFHLKDNKILWFQFTLRGKSLSWDSTGWQTGITNELRQDDVKYYPASKTIETDHNTNSDFMKLVKSILETRAAEEPLFAQALALLK